MPDSKAPIVPTSFRCDRHAPSDGAVLVTVAGELDLVVAPEVDQALCAALAEADSVVIDRRALECMDSTGVHLLLAANRRARDLGRDFAIISGPTAVQRTFELTGAADVLPFVDRPGASHPEAGGDRRSLPLAARSGSGNHGG